MVKQGEEPNRVFGVPIGTGGRREEEPQHVMGLPVGWFQGVDLSPLRSLIHPVREYRRWARRRRLGPYDTDEDEPGKGALAVAVRAGTPDGPGREQQDKREEPEP